MKSVLILSLLTILVHSSSSKDCPNTSFECLDGETCCRLPVGEGWGCCPYRNAVCCKDRLHCCPEGLKCDTKAGRCLGSKYKLLLTKLDSKKSKKSLTKLETKKIKSTNDIQHLDISKIFKNRKVCPDEDFSCELLETCCPLKSQGWGCCPLGPKAVCCKDGQHCCPEGSICHEKTGQCIGIHH